MRRRRPDPVCLACGSARMQPWQRICGACWKLLPFERRRAIAEAGQERKRHVVAGLAADAARWLKQHSPAAEAARRTGEPV